MAFGQALARRSRTLEPSPGSWPGATGRARHRARAFSWLCALFLFVGNAARLIHVPGLTDNVLVSEIVLDLAALSLLAVSGRARWAFFRYALPLVAVICLSALIGVMQWGLLPIPVIYALRLALGVTVGVLLGHTLFTEFGPDVRRVVRRALFFYILMTIVALLLLLLFPDAERLWQLLARFGIEFNGDPHQQRLLSTYFDPNFFSVILLLPLSWSLAYLLKRFAVSWLVAFTIFVFAIILTGSRSGLLSAGLIIFLLVLKRGSELLLGHFNIRRALRHAVILPALLLAGLPFYVGALFRTFDRIASVFDDRSAAARFDSLDFGWSVIRDHLWFGVGYNYLSVFTERYRQLSSLDSSMQVVLASFGVLLSAVLVLLAISYIWLDLRRVSPQLRFLLQAQLICLAVTLLFAAQFNNVAFYLFWLIPALAAGVYLSRCCRAGGSGVRI